MARIELKKCPYCGSEVDTVSVKEKDGNICIEVKAKDRWIPCNERLPEIDEDVLVYYTLWKDNPIQIAHLQYDCILFESSDGEFNFKASAVTHWMPLPEPPKE